MGCGCTRTCIITTKAVSRSALVAYDATYLLTSVSHLVIARCPRCVYLQGCMHYRMAVACECERQLTVLQSGSTHDVCLSYAMQRSP